MLLTTLATRIMRSSRSGTTLSFLIRRRFSTSIPDPSRSLHSSTFNYHPPFSSDFVLFSRRINGISQSKIHKNLAAYNSVRQGSSSPSGNSSKSRKRWGVGILAFLITLLPFSSKQLNSFLELKNEVEMIVEDAEIVADVVEKVAEEVVEITENLGDKLPEGGKLKGAINLVENVAKEIVKDANIAEELIHKVEEVEKEVDSITENVRVTKEASDGSIPTDNYPEKSP